jgi:hypothetical protein
MNVILLNPLGPSHPLAQYAVSLTFQESFRTVFVDDAPKLRWKQRRRAAHFMSSSGSSTCDGRLRWLAGRGHMAAQDGGQTLRGTFYAVDKRKQLEAKLLAVNQTLEARVGATSFPPAKDRGRNAIIGCDSCWGPSFVGPVGNQQAAAGPVGRTASHQGADGRRLGSARTLGAEGKRKITAAVRRVRFRRCK